VGDHIIPKNPQIVIDGKMYLPLEDVCNVYNVWQYGWDEDFMSYPVDYEWDSSTMTAKIESSSGKEVVIGCNPSFGQLPSSVMTYAENRRVPDLGKYMGLTPIAKGTYENTYGHPLGYVCQYEYCFDLSSFDKEKFKNKFGEYLNLLEASNYTLLGEPSGVYTLTITMDSKCDDILWVSLDPEEFSGYMLITISFNTDAF